MAGDHRAIADALPETVQSVFKSFYIIPDFQRPYVWTKRQVLDLVKDIRDEYRDSGEDGTHYFLGSIVVYSEQPETYALVDGQQRLTTLYILFCAIRDRLKQADKKNDDVGFLQQAITGGAVGKGGVTKYKARVKVEYEADQRVVDAIGTGKTKALNLKKKDGGKHLLDAYNTALSFLTEEFGEDVDELRAYAYFLLTKVELIKIVTIDFLRALVIFERINDRGMGLNALDLLKNLLFKMSGSEEHGDLAKSWHGVIETLRKGGEKNHMRFLRYFLAANFDLDSDKVVKADDVFEWFVKNKEKLGLGRRTKSFVSRLQVAADDYVHMLHGMGPDGRAVEALAGIVAQKGSVRQHLPILMAARKFPAAEFTRLAEHLETLCLVFALSNAQWNELEKVGPAWCRKLRDIDGDEAKLTQFLQNDFRMLVNDKLAAAFEQLDRTDEIRPSLLKYMLARIAQRVDRDCGKKVELESYLDNNVTVEHVLPQSLAINAVHEGFGDVESARKHVHRLGNLTLLDRGPNASVSDDAFEKKKRAYERSNYELTKALVTDLEFGKRTRYGATSAQYGFKPFQKWNPEAVESRQSQLRAVMKRIWNI